MNTSQQGETRSDFMSGLQDAIQKNPISAALIGVGFLWIFAGGKNITAAAALFPAAAKGAASSIGASWQRSSELASDAAEGLRSVGASALEGVKSTVSDAKEAAGEMFDADNKNGPRNRRAGNSIPAQQDKTAFNGLAASMQQNLSETFERQPLLLGAIGLAVGCAMAAALPSTSMEDEWVGSAAERTKAQAAEFASNAAAKVVDTAERTYEALKEGVVEQGLTPDAIRAGAETIGEKLKTVANDAGSSFKS